MLPAVLTLADTKGTAAAETAAIKSDTVPVPPIVATTAGARLELPA